MICWPLFTKQREDMFLTFPFLSSPLLSIGPSTRLLFLSLFSLGLSSPSPTSWLVLLINLLHPDLLLFNPPRSVSSTLFLSYLTLLFFQTLSLTLTISFPIALIIFICFYLLLFLSPFLSLLLFPSILPWLEASISIRFYLLDFLLLKGLKFVDIRCNL